MPLMRYPDDFDDFDPLDLVDDSRCESDDQQRDELASAGFYDDKDDDR